MYLQRDDNPRSAPHVCTNETSTSRAKKYENPIVHIKHSHTEQDKRHLEDKILLKIEINLYLYVKIVSTVLFLADKQLPHTGMC